MTERLATTTPSRLAAPNQMTPEQQERDPRFMYTIAAARAASRLVQADRLMEANPDTSKRPSLARTMQLDELGRKSHVTPADQAALVILGMPAAHRTQQEIARQAENDRRQHRRPITNRTLAGRLIVFHNDIFDALDGMPASALPTFRAGLRQATHDVFDSRGVEVMNDVEYNRVISGIGLEYATYTALDGALPEGWMVERPSTLDDLDGSDMLITSEEGIGLGVDIKTEGGYERHLKELWQQDIISNEAYQAALQDRYLYMPSKGRKTERRLQMIVDGNNLGETVDDGFRFKYPVQVAGFFVEHLEDEDGPAGPDDRTLRNLGKTGIIK